MKVRVTCADQAPASQPGVTVGGCGYKWQADWAAIQKGIHCPNCGRWARKKLVAEAAAGRPPEQLAPALTVIDAPRAGWFTSKRHYRKSVFLVHFFEIAALHQPPPPQTPVPRTVLAAAETMAIVDAAMDRSDVTVAAGVKHDATTEVMEHGGDPLVGKQFADCVVERKLGEGGMGAVYLGTQHTLDRKVAIKVLPRAMSIDPEFVARFIREAKAAARLDHPNCCAVYSVGNQGATYFIVMQFIDGESLGDRLEKRGAFAQADAVRVIRDSARGLQAAHRAGIIHRDIKPDNIMLTRAGDVKVTDFGLARDVRGDRAKTSQQGYILGTPYYMAPEQAEGTDVDARADIYSLGVTFYHILAGHRPYEGSTTFAILARHREGNAKPIEEMVPGLAPQVARIVRRMMRPDRNDRYDDCAALLAELDAVDLKALRDGAAPVFQPPGK